MVFGLHDDHGMFHDDENVDFVTDRIRISQLDCRNYHRTVRQLIHESPYDELFTRTNWHSAMLIPISRHVS